MTEENCEKIYHNLKRVYGKEIGLEEAYKSVAEIVKPRLWRRFHKAFMAMKSKDEPLYREPIAKEMTHYFLQQILAEDGENGLRLALNALKTHMKHYRSVWHRPMIGYDDLFKYFFAKLQPKNAQKAKTVSNPLQNTTTVEGEWIVHEGEELIEVKISRITLRNYNRKTKKMRIVGSHGTKVDIPCTEQEYKDVGKAIRN